MREKSQSSGATQLVLASASPRRLELLRTLGLDADVIPADIDESVLSEEAPRDYVMRVAVAKAQTVLDSLDGRTDKIVIAADTSVVVGGQILGKPQDARDAERMLSALSGVEHAVFSAVVVGGARVPLAQRLAETRVWMRETTRAERAAYWATGEPADKAGGYAIQGLGAMFIDRIEGNFATVMGLPVAELTTLLALHGIDPLRAAQETH
ncbi:MAG: Maf family protein [Granulosicoccaceae bacterium]